MVNVCNRSNRFHSSIYVKVTFQAALNAARTPASSSAGDGPAPIAAAPAPEAETAHGWRGAGGSCHAGVRPWQAQGCGDGVGVGRSAGGHPIASPSRLKQAQKGQLPPSS